MFATGTMWAACGGHADAPVAPRPIALEPVIAAQAWFRAPAPCGQGPYELELPITDAAWGEEIELRLATPRRIALHAVVIADDVEVARTQGVYGSSGATSGRPDNARCVADARERLAATRVAPITATTPSRAQAPSSSVAAPVAETAPAAAAIALVPDDGLAPASQEVVRFAWDGHARHRVHIALWSIDPNDLADVRFGIARVEWHPNVPDAEYTAFLARAQAAAAKRAEVHVAVETDAQRTARIAAEAAAELVVIEEGRRHEIAEALEAQRVIARAAYCASHAEDRECWGAGGRRVHDDLERHDRERAQYCVATPEDARCWDDRTWRLRRDAWRARIHTALAPPQQPEGPPPAPLADDAPPKLSAHAEWRPGYWQWTGTTWTWLAGMWRVPESDILAELTTIAPSAPPPPQAETIGAAPMAALIGSPASGSGAAPRGYGSPGSWQRPEAGAIWQPAEWRARGAQHVLVPGRWVVRS